jgi:predicted alpha/beta-fold hydrolase
VHFRGCSGAPNRRPRAYHSGDADEIDWILRRLQADHSTVVFAVGVSLGGNALLKWLGREGDQAASVVNACAAVSAPLNLATAGAQLEKGFNRVYADYFLSTMKPKSLAKLRDFPDLYPPAAVRDARTLRAFDDAVTAPLHGFRDVDDYWTRASSLGDLHRIGVRTLLIHARNDPFLPGRFLPDPDRLPVHITCEFPPSGGHAGFVSGPFPGNQSWLPSRILDYFDEVTDAV